MPNNGGAILHHISKRKRVSVKANESNAVRIFDKIMLIVAIVNPLIAIPQVVHIFSLKTALGLSLTSWLGYTAFNIPWLVYGFIHKEKPLIIAYILALMFNLIIVIGILKYG